MNGSRLFVCYPPSSAAARALDATDKNLLPIPLLRIHGKCQDVARVHTQTRWKELIHNKIEHKTKHEVSYSLVALVQMCGVFLAKS